jgi:ABC-type antimicrobial peptide transport system permease subunit
MKTILRSLKTRKLFTLLNTAGLAIGFAISILIFILIRHELSIDRFHSKQDRIYRVVSTETFRDGQVVYDGCAPLPLSAALREEFPQAEKVAAVYRSRKMEFSMEDHTLFKIPLLYFVEPSFFDIFDYPWIAGDPQTALQEPFTMAVSRKVAEKWFGTWQQAMGKEIYEGEGRQPYRITGVMDTPPANTDIDLSVALSYASLRVKLKENFTNPRNWDNFTISSQCFFLLGQQQRIASMEAQLPAFVSKHYGPLFANSNSRDSSYFQPLKEMHFNAQFDRYGEQGWSYTELTVMGLIGLFLLGVACINFINLSTIQSFTRAKEVGVRKALGSSRTQLFTRFIGETAIMVGMAIIMGIILAAVFLPYLKVMLNKPVSMQLMNVSTILFLGLLGMVTTFLAGVYPGLVLSRINPVITMKLKATGNVPLRRGLIILQFIIAQVLIMGTIVISRQMQFFREQPMGFDREAIVMVDLPWRQEGGYTYLKEQVSRIPGVLATTLCDASPANNIPRANFVTFENSIHPENFEINYANVDTDYVKTFQLQIKEGRFPRTKDEVILNETAARMLGFDDPSVIIGKRLRLGDTSRPLVPIVGILKDYHNAPLRDKILPMLMTTDPGNLHKLAVKIRPSQLTTAMSGIEQVYTNNFPAHIFEAEFLDDQISRFYGSEVLINRLFKIFTILAIFISCMGMYGLVSFLVMQKTREVGIRKVLGASVGQIVQLFLREFIWLAGFAFIVAAPLGYYYMHQWLAGFHYHIGIGWDVFIIAMLLSLLVVVVSVGYKATVAGLANPVKSLKTE